jgi:aminocarboxymuconate-semialdehyde decarboxylase
MIDDHVNGLTYDHDLFEPVWEAAQDLRVFLLIHQFQPTTVTYRTRRYFLLNSIGNLVDRTITFAAFIYGGVLDRYPDLTICLCHGGGYVPYALDRLDKGWEVWSGERGESQDRPSTYVRRFFYDTVVYTPRNLRFLIDVVGADRVVFGSDVGGRSFGSQLSKVVGAAIPEPAKRLILRENLRGLLAPILKAKGQE